MSVFVSFDPAQFSVKLDTAAGRYSTVVTTAEEYPVDENQMAVWVPFSDGNTIDGVGDIVEVSGIDTTRHIRNPIVGLDHFKSVPLPIGISENPKTKQYTVEIDPVKKVAKGLCFFYRGTGMTGVDKQKEYDHAVLASQVFDLWVKKYLRSGSFGYTVQQADHLPPYRRNSDGSPVGLHLKKTLLLEYSIVVLPANQSTTRKSLDLGGSAREILCMGKVCGRPLSPVLVKSLQPYTVGNTKVQVGFDSKAQPPPETPRGWDSVGTEVEDDGPGEFILPEDSLGHEVIDLADLPPTPKRKTPPADPGTKRGNREKKRQSEKKRAAAKKRYETRRGIEKTEEMYPREEDTKSLRAFYKARNPGRLGAKPTTGLYSSVNSTTHPGFSASPRELEQLDRERRENVQDALERRERVAAGEIAPPSRNALDQARYIARYHRRAGRDAAMGDYKVDLINRLRKQEIEPTKQHHDAAFAHSRRMFRSESFKPEGEEQHFYDAAIENPEDRAPWDMYHDYLLERGRTHEADIIRADAERRSEFQQQKERLKKRKKKSLGPNNTKSLKKTQRTGTRKKKIVHSDKRQRQHGDLLEETPKHERRESIVKRNYGKGEEKSLPPEREGAKAYTKSSPTFFGDEEWVEQEKEEHHIKSLRAFYQAKNQEGAGENERRKGFLPDPVRGLAQRAHRVLSAGARAGLNLARAAAGESPPDPDSERRPAPAEQRQRRMATPKPVPRPASQTGLNREEFENWRKQQQERGGPGVTPTPKNPRKTPPDNGVKSLRAFYGKKALRRVVTSHPKYRSVMGTPEAGESVPVEDPQEAYREETKFNRFRRLVAAEAAECAARESAKKKIKEEDIPPEEGENLSPEQLEMHPLPTGKRRRTALLTPDDEIHPSPEDVNEGAVEMSREHRHREQGRKENRSNKKSLPTQKKALGRSGKQNAAARQNLARKLRAQGLTPDQVRREVYRQSQAARRELISQRQQEPIHAYEPPADTSEQTEEAPPPPEHGLRIYREKQLALLKKMFEEQNSAIEVLTKNITSLENRI